MTDEKAYIGTAFMLAVALVARYYRNEWRP